MLPDDGFLNWNSQEHYIVNFNVGFNISRENYFFTPLDKYSRNNIP